MCAFGSQHLDYAQQVAKIKAEREAKAEQDRLDAINPPKPLCELCGERTDEVRQFGEFSYIACVDVTACEARRKEQMLKDVSEPGVERDEEWPM